MADANTIATLVDIAIGATALAGVTALRGDMRKLKRRLGIVEKRTTPPPGELSTITDIASGPVLRVRAATEPGKR